MTTSESKGRFFYKKNRFAQRIDSNRELECSSVESFWNALRHTAMLCTGPVSVEAKLSFVEPRRRWAYSPSPVKPLVFLTRVL